MLRMFNDRSISLQFTDPAYNNTPWYGDYKLASDIPSPNNVTFEPSIYVSHPANGKTM